MKKLVAISMILILAATGIFYVSTHKNQAKTSKPIAYNIAPSPSPTVVPITKQKTYLFVPYWSMQKKQAPTNYDSLIYFGITPGDTGIDTSDSGYTNITTFIKHFSSDKTYLAVRMTNQQINNKVLKDKNLQDAIITDSIRIAKRNHFKGIVLDFEESALSFDSVIQGINDFQKKFYAQTTTSNISLLTTIYGDTFYRLRPYDMKVISKNTDEVLIMAYDFHKANGNPGPNFPLSGKATYGYDLAQMTTDFVKNVPIQKLSVVFGMFGYDWTVDTKNQSINQAEPLSLSQIQQKFLPTCTEKDCRIKRDTTSSETTITYTDNQNKKHIVWFEDASSSSQKESFLKQQGIPGVGYWAYSYF